MRRGRLRGEIAAIVVMAGCATASWEPPRGEPLASPPPEAVESSSCQPAPARIAPPSRRAPPNGARLELGLAETSLDVPAGRWAILVKSPARAYVTLGLAGHRDALRRFELVGAGALEGLRAGVLDGDGKLPAFVSFEAPEQTSELICVVEVDRPVRLMRVDARLDDIGPRDAKALRLGHVAARPLVGLPFPLEPGAGYALQHPHRYQFVRADVAAALRAALRQTRIRFKRNALAIGDASQWDGERPAADLGKPRHISHQGGRDIDIALPTLSDGPARIERHCDGVLVEQQELRCAPGTVKDVDGLRLAYFLGLLIDGPTPQGRHIPDPQRRPGPIAVVETIFTDQVYIDEIRKALDVLRKRRWIHDEAYGALGEDGLLRPSPWHTDHVHVRFQGEPARVPPPLRFAAEPRIEASGRVVAGQQ